jgi:hypothetical protein
MLWIVGAPRALAMEPSATWVQWTASPLPTDEKTLSPLERSALARCDRGEAGLQQAAKVVVARKLMGQPVPGPDELALAQRSSGEPHPWARAWVATGRALEQEPTIAKLDAWLGPQRKAERRCGVASAMSPDGTRALAVVSIDAVADLLPLPTHARAGQWLLVEGRLRVQASAGQVIVLGPSGVPRSMPTSFERGVLRAHFAPERPGRFTVQVLADVGAGLRPVLEASVFADIAPGSPSSRMAPGEELGGAVVPDDELLARMINEARASAGVAPVSRDANLDDVARRHAERMVGRGELAHDLGEGDPRERLRAAGVEARYAGENVAHALNVPLAHRFLWSSPSHRANLLGRDFHHVGVAVTRDERGDAWVVELFTGD